MKLGVSITITMEQARKLVKPSDIPHSYLQMIDFVTEFARSHNLEWIEIASFPPFSADTLMPIKQEIKQKLADYNVSFHLPAWEINISALDTHVRNTAVNEIKKSLDLVHYLEIKKTVLHPGSYGTMADIYQLFSPLVISNTKQSVAEIVSHANTYDIEVNIENLPYSSPFFNTPHEFADFIDKGSGITLDTAHAITSNVDPIEFIHSYPNSIKEVHLVDGYKNKRDNHYAPGTGELDFESIFKALHQIEYDGHYILEMMNPDTAKKGLEFIRSVSK